MTSECPTCGDEFDSEMGMKVHHNSVHGESLVETSTCEHCGDEYTVDSGSRGRFCSLECVGKAKRKRVEKDCKQCGETFTTHEKRKDRATFCCKECKDDYLRGETKQFVCAQCGRTETRPEYDKREHCCKECEAEANLTRPRPDDPEMLVWLLFVYEDFTVEETHRRIRANVGNSNRLFIKEIREIIRENGWNKKDITSYHIRKMDPSEAGFDPVPDGRDSYKQVSQ